MKPLEIRNAKIAYSRGQNVTNFLRLENHLTFNTPEVIETAYDLQAGTYIEYTLQNLEVQTAYVNELSEVLNSYISSVETLLDVGSGELTTLSPLINKLRITPREIYAFDISWSRIYLGLEFARKVAKELFPRIRPFVADILELPIPDKSIDICTSSHALEPNGQNLKKILIELFRVTRDKLILFEPYYEANSLEGQRRMDSLGYIKNLKDVVDNLGGNVIETIPIKHITNHLNPTFCFVITPPPTDKRETDSIENAFTLPATNYPLVRIDNFFYSSETGLCFPILKDIPILKSSNAILATKLC